MGQSLSLSLRSFASFGFEVLVEALAPSRCASCDARVRMLAAFCPSCAATIEIDDESEGEGGALVYAGAVARAIVRMKYEQRPDLARPLGDLLCRAIEGEGASVRSWSDVLVVPVPLHPLRLAERGFNQSALLAARVCRQLGAPFEPRALVRTRPTSQQATLDRAGRAANVARAFRVRDDALVRGRAVLLVDDVMTTGATLDACAQAIREGGGASVARAVVAIAAHRVVKSAPPGPGRGPA